MDDNISHSIFMGDGGDIDSYHKILLAGSAEKLPDEENYAMS